MSWRVNDVGRRWAVALLVCLLAATSIVQVAHFHKDAASPRHACTLCATHAPALAAQTGQVARPLSTLRPIYLPEAVQRSSTSVRTFFIRPPPAA